MYIPVAGPKRAIQKKKRSSWNTGSYCSIVNQLLINVCFIWSSPTNIIKIFIFIVLRWENNAHSLKAHWKPQPLINKCCGLNELLCSAAWCLVFCVLCLSYINHRKRNKRHKAPWCATLTNKIKILLEQCRA